MKILSKRKKIVFFIILIILSAVAGVFLWQKYKKPDIPYVLSEEFTITEANGEKIIEYKKTGFKIRIPGDWDIDGSSRTSLLITSPDFQLHPNVGPFGAPLPEKGCVASIEIIKGDSPGMEYSYIKELLEVCPTLGQDCNEYKIVEINGNRGLKYIYSLEENFIPGRSIWIRVPKNKKLYIFEAYLFSQDRERCEQEFDNILSTVEIKK